MSAALPFSSGAPARASLRADGVRPRAGRSAAMSDDRFWDKPRFERAPVIKTVGRCRFPGCPSLAAPHHRGLCHRCYGRLRYQGRLEQCALPRDPRGRKSRAWHDEHPGAVFHPHGRGPARPRRDIEAPDPDEPRPEQQAEIARRIAELRANGALAGRG